MRVTLTAKLKLLHTQEQKTALDAVTLAYRDALNFASLTAAKLGNTASSTKLHKEVYPIARGLFGLKAQAACTVSREVAAKYKALWTKFEDHQKRAAMRAKAGLKPKRFKGFDSPPKFVSRTLMLQYQRDFSFKQGQQVSVNTLDKRIVVPYLGYAKHLQYILMGAEIGAATLWYHRQKKQYYLLVAFSITVPDPQPSDHQEVVGVDVGSRYHVVASDSQERSFFKSGKEARQKKDHFARLRRDLQRKGTRSATRRLVAISGRERRFIADWNHRLSIGVLSRYPQTFIGLEDLSHIRERTEGGSNPGASKKAKAAKRRKSQWSFAEFQAMLAYKAPLHGSMTVKVDADYTSQCCIRCGHTSKANRPKNGLMFRCERCGYEVHSDLLGSRNIAMRTLVVRQDWMTTGHLSTAPDVSCDEAKTARLQRYAGLRWSIDTNLRL